MKIRNGFVSNSSSSSFCIYGVTAAEQEIKDGLIAQGATEDDLADGVSEYLENWGYNSRKRSDSLTSEDIAGNEKKFFKAEEGFESHNPYYDYGDDIYLGVAWSSIGDDETGKQFRDRIDAKLTELFGKETVCGTLEEAWRDG